MIAERYFKNFGKEFLLHLKRSRHPLLAHSAAVAARAASLARRNGADPARAAAAGYLHDWLKPLPPARMMALVKLYRVKLDRVQRETPVLWHGPVAAARARREFRLRDADVLEAVRWHTTGCARGSRLSRIIFVADFCAEGREYPEAAIAARIARRSLPLAVRYVLASKLAHLDAIGASPHPAALALWRDIVGRHIHA